jgi:hypothetical protein
MSVSSCEFDRSPGAVVLRFPSYALRRRAAARRRALALRRTAAALALLAVLVLVLLGGGGGSGTASAGSAPALGPHAVVIRPGQTIWDLAERYAPATMDPRAYVDQVLDMNHLSGAPAAGMSIRLPR